jgi:putative Holliday junction resolvase
MGFDFGTRKIGVAVGQSLTGTVTGIASIRTREGGGHLKEIEQLVRQWRCDTLVVGLPLTSEGEPTPSSRAARAFGEDLGKRLGLPVYWVNEFLTSQAAQAQLTESLQSGKRFSRRRQSDRDLVAAELILSSYLESRNSES